MDGRICRAPLLTITASPDQHVACIVAAVIRRAESKLSDASKTDAAKACLAVRQCISFTVWGFGDADSWVPGFFTGEGYATIYDVNLNPKPAYTELQQDLRLAAFGTPHRVPSGAGL
jgi:GH35 family endo-1,4-beta-xylanase